MKGQHSYYALKRQGTELIDGLVKKAIYDLDQICFIVERETGLSEKFTRSFLERGVLGGFYVLKEGGVYSVSSD